MLNRDVTVAIRDLTPNLCYRFQLSGKSKKFNYDGVITEFKVVTHGYSEPTNFKWTDKTDKSVTVAWLDPEYKLSQEKKDYYYEITVKPQCEECGNLSLPKLRVPSEENSKQIQGLEPSKKYKITIETKFNIKIDQTCPTDYIRIKRNGLTATVLATTLPPTPEMPIISDITERTAMVNWTKAKVINENDPVWYTIRYTSINPNTTEKDDKGVDDTRRTKKNYTILENLKRGKTYKVHLTVTSEELGASEPSPAIIFKTISLTNQSQRDLTQNLGMNENNDYMKGQKLVFRRHINKLRLIFEIGVSKMKNVVTYFFVGRS